MEVPWAELFIYLHLQAAPAVCILPGLTGGTAVYYIAFQNGHDLLIHSNSDLLYNSLIIEFYFLRKFGTLKF